MAVRTRGLTVTIDGDTTGLTKALSNVNREVKNTQAQLKDVDKLLKLDPTNTELLSQKQRLLGDAISETRTKLDTLKTASDQANVSLANGEITQEQYDALQREIIETTEELKRLEAQAEKSSTAVQSIAAKGEKLKTIGNNISDVGKKFMPATIAVAGLGAAAIKTASDFDTQMSKVAAISGATGKEFDDLKAKAREMGSKTKFSATEAGEAFEYMSMAGWKTQDMLDGIEGIMNLAAASGEDLATTSDIVTDALTAFGLTAKDSGHFADILAAASSNANTNVSMMGETFKYAAPIAGALGYTAEDTALAIGLMANAGIKSSQAGTSLRKMMTELQGDIKLSGEAIGDVTIKTTNADGTMRELNDILMDCRTAFSGLTESEKASAAEALVGKTAMSGFLAIMNASEEDVNKLATAIGNCDGASQKMADTMQDNLEGQLTKLKSALQELAISFGEILIPVVREIVEHIQHFVDWLNSLGEGTKKMIVKIALFVAAIGPVLIIVGKVISAVGTIMTIVPKLVSAVKAVKTGITALNAVMMANPILLIIAAIAALVAAFIYLWNNCEEFRQFWIDLWEGIKEVAITVWNAIKDFFVQLWEGIKTVAETVWNGLRDFFVGLWNGIKELAITVWTAVGDFFTGLWQGIQTVATTVWNAIAEFFTGLWNGIKMVAETVWNGIATFFTTLWTGISETASTIWTGISDFFTGLWNGIKETASTVWTAISDFFTQHWETTKQNATTAWDNISTFLSNTWEKTKSTAKTVWDSVSTFFSNTWENIKTNTTTVGSNIASFLSESWSTIKSNVTSAASTIRDRVGSTFNTMLSGIRSTCGNILGAVRSGFDAAVNWITGLASAAYNWGRDIIMGIVNGIKSAISWVSDACRSVANTISSWLHFSVPDVGPLTDYESWMPDFMKGLAKGIEKSKGLVADAMAGVAGTMNLSPMLQTAGAGMTGAGIHIDAGMLAQLIDAVSGMNRENSGDITIPVYIGQDRIDEIVVTAAQRAAFRSGGR